MKPASYKNWFWAIETQGGGPDYCFVASFRPEDTPKLQEILLQQPIPGYHLHPQAQHPYGLSLTFINDYAYQKLQEPERNPGWFNGSVELRNHTIYITCAYGVCEQPVAETDLIATLAQRSDITLTEWRITGEGQGYNSKEFAQGNEASSLMLYLTDSVLEAH